MEEALNQAGPREYAIRLDDLQRQIYRGYYRRGRTMYRCDLTMNKPLCYPLTQVEISRRTLTAEDWIIIPAQEFRCLCRKRRDLPENSMEVLLDDIEKVIDRLRGKGVRVDTSVMEIEGRTKMVTINILSGRGYPI